MVTSSMPHFRQSLPAPTRSGHALRRAALIATVSALLASCAHDGGHARSASTNGADGVAPNGVALAEHAAAAHREDAALRLQLARAYLKAGRFESARAACADALALDDAHPGALKPADRGTAVLDLALAAIALDRNADAIAAINARGESIPAPDAGLALVLAGDNEQGLTILTEGLRQTRAQNHEGPRQRQNLALAYAVSGAWREARIVAGQDLPAGQLDARMREWAALIEPGSRRRLVATLLGVTPQDDPGQPAALALAQLAPAPAPEPARPVAEANAARLIEPQPATAAPVAPPAPKLAQLDLPPVTAAPAPAAPQAAPQAATVPAPARKVAAKSVAPTHFVQLGAFASEANAHRAWTTMAARDARLRPLQPVITRIEVNGHPLWRLQAAGFVGAAKAMATCATIQAKGGACLVVAARSVIAPQLAALHPTLPAMARAARR